MAYELSESSDADDDHRGFLVELPEDAYAASMSWFVDAVHKMEMKEAMFWAPQILAPCVALAAAQIAIVVFVWRAVDRMDPCAPRAHELLQVIGVAVFVGEMLNEGLEAINTLYCIWMSTENLGWYFRVLLTALFVLPKATVVVLLTFVGSKFVLMAEDDVELILNCVALTFVNSMDDVMFNNIYALYDDELAKWSVFFERKSLRSLELQLLVARTWLWAALILWILLSQPAAQC
ncbi:unnamed protein product [Symbiodinium natans]|uniref:Uncharacterized protein n=1 Tax=Symbiodinium natans TaxID=878477 RepID=A0A812T659_9DINO|nr:unnamed protein product [Symbiodinium natans]